jgi:hypothetical protein
MIEKYLRRRFEGIIVKVGPNPGDPHSQEYIEVKDGRDSYRLTFNEKFRDENHIMTGRIVSWYQWSIPILNHLLNPVCDISHETKTKK